MYIMLNKIKDGMVAGVALSITVAIGIAALAQRNRSRLSTSTIRPRIRSAKISARRGYSRAADLGPDRPGFPVRLVRP